MKKALISVMLLVAVLLSATACGQPQGNAFTCQDVVDSSATQQRWLKNPDSTIVVNPDAVGASEYKDANGKLGLELGVMNSKGEIAKTLEDVFFVVEPTFANGKGGEEVWAANWTDDSVLIYQRTHPEATSENILTPFEELEAYDEAGNKIRYSTVDPETGAVEFQLDVNAHYDIMANYGVPVNGDLDYYVLVDCETSDMDRWNAAKTKSYPKVWQVRGYFDDVPTSNTSVYRGDDYTYATILEYVTKQPGFYYENLNEAAAGYVGANKTDTLYPTVFLEREGIYKFRQFSIKAIEDEVRYGTGANYYTWTPYSIKSYQEYDNGTVLEAVDIISGPNAVTREITGILGGVAHYGGYLNGGKATVEAALGAINLTLQVKGDGFEYTVAFGTMGSIEFYDSYEDMLNMDNGYSEPSDKAQYWLFVPDARILPESTTYVGIAASVTGEDTVEAAEKAGASKTYRIRMNDLESIWDDYIANYDVSDYIVNVPGDE